MHPLHLNPNSAASHFARITPIVGHELRARRVALAGLPATAPLAEYLAACGVGRWLWLAEPGTAGLRAALEARHGAALALEAHDLAPGAWLAMLVAGAADLLVAPADLPELPAALASARSANIPALLVAPPSDFAPCRALVLLPEDQSDLWNGAHSWCQLAASNPRLLPPEWDWVVAAPLVAGLARALLLRDTPFARADLAALWADGVREFRFGGPGEPLHANYRGPGASAKKQEPGAGPAPFRTPPARRGVLLVAGLGSLGSVAATLLGGSVAGMLLADPDHVEVFNPARQAYLPAEIGQPKAQALAERLSQLGAPNVLGLPSALTDERAVVELVERPGVTAALIATGTAADFAIARALRDLGVPHVVGRCYPRARFWEAIVVDGRRGPALSDLRGHLAAGPTPAPTPEQIADYSDAGALDAEPATLIESGWAAAWMARLAAQLLAPPGLRERWLLELLAAKRTCLIGGVGVEPTAGGPAYGVTAPGQVRAVGPAQVRGP